MVFAHQKPRALRPRGQELPHALHPCGVKSRPIQSGTYPRYLCPPAAPRLLTCGSWYVTRSRQKAARSERIVQCAHHPVARAQLARASTLLHPRLHPYCVEVYCGCWSDQLSIITRNKGHVHSKLGLVYYTNCIINWEMGMFEVYVPSGYCTPRSHEMRSSPHENGTTCL